MKELSIEEKAKAYDEVVKRAKIEKEKSRNLGLLEFIDENFPELKEPEDEIMVKFIKNQLFNIKKTITDNYELDAKLTKAIDWLEKRCKETLEPNWCHHKVDLSNCSEEYRKAYYDGWNNCNMQHSQCSSELDDVVKCLINGMKFYYEDNEEATWGTDKWSMPVKHIIEVLEQILANSAKTCKDEQKPVNKIEPPKSQWKPSDEQMEALDNARHSNPFNVHVLDTLFHDLKKLREE